MLRLAAAGVWALAAGGAAGSTSEFDEDMARVERSMSRGAWVQARSELLSVLEEHGDQTYVRQRAAEIEQYLDESAFRIATPTPDPRDLVDGDLISWNEGSGQLELRYRSRDGGALFGSRDFTVEGRGRDAAYLHPVHFEGSYTVRISGNNRYPNRGMQVLVGIGQDEAYLVVFGPGRIIHVDATGDQELLDSDDQVSIERGDRFAVKVKVAASSITAFYNGKKVLAGKKTRGVFGRFGFRDIHGIEEIEIQGEASGSWIRGLVDAHMQRERESFFRGYERGQDLPDWWQREVVEVERAGYPGPQRPGYSTLLAELAGHLEQETYEAALERLSALEEGAASPEFTSYFRALFLLRLERARAALVALQPVVQGAPGFTPARVLQAEARLELGQLQLARAEIEEVLEREPGSAEAYRVLVIACLREGRLEEAQAALDRAVVGGASGAALTGAARFVARARNGPAWGRVFEYKNKSYVVQSDLGEDVCFEAAGHLQESLRLFERRLRRLQGDPPRFRVYIFAGQASYAAYAGDVMGGGGEFTAGLYSPLLKQLLIWNLPDTDQLFRTVRHEGFHQYFDSLLGPSPRWLNEGLAEYFETSEYRNSRLVDGLPNRGALDRLRNRERELGPWDEFLRMTPREFMAEPGRNYAQAWLLCHWLMTDREGQALLDDLLDRLIAGEASEAAVASVFEGRVEGLASDLLGHFKAL